MGGVAWVDYAVFAAMVLLSGLLAVYSRLSASKTAAGSGKRAFSFATGTVSSAAVLMSIARTGIGIRVFLGYPAELFYHGAGMWETMGGVAISFILVDVLFMPVYFAMPTTSIYEYLELRFRSGFVRRMTSLLYVVRCVLMLGVTTLTPCIAMQAVLQVPYWLSIIAVGFFGILFTTFGGMRGVILNDGLQAVALFLCTLAILFRASMQLPDGIVGAFKTASDHQRLNLLNFDLDPTLRMTTVSAVVGQVFISSSVYGCQQAFAQRYRSLPNRRAVVRTLLMAIPVIGFLEALVWISGVAVFALYATCDPLSAGFIKNIDGLIPYFVQKEFVAIPGLLGFFLASLFNGAFGVMVAILNSVATVTWEDFLSNIKYVRNLSDSKQLIVIRFIGVMYAVGIMVVALAVSMLPGLVESSVLISSTASGPLLGVFLLALLFPSANKYGAVAGVVVSMVWALCLTTGRLLLSHGKTTLLPLSTESCPANSSRADEVMQKYNFGPPPAAPLDWRYLFSVTFMYYAMMGCLICILTGLIVSHFTASKEDCYPASLVHPLARKLSAMLPGEPRVYLADPTTSAPDASLAVLTVSGKLDCSQRSLQNLSQGSSLVVNVHELMTHL